MILYLDTSALLKLYLIEEHSEAVRTAVDQAERTAIAVIGYAEARAALARRSRDGSLSDEEAQEALTALERDWEVFVRPEVTEGMARLAGILAQRHALRGMDAVHLAAALMLHQETGDARFLGFDARLAEAARATMPILMGADTPES